MVVDSDPIEREALLELIQATTLRTTSILMDQWRGALSREMVDIDQLIANRNFSEAKERLLSLKFRWAFGKHLIDPWKVVLAGPPNSGKSSLLNRLLGYTRAIVHEQAGTTRDLLTEQTSIDGWPVQLIDGAGIRDAHHAADAIEATGIARTLDVISTADCTLLLIDPSSDWTETHSRIAENCRGKLILVFTKSDLSVPPNELPGIPHHGVVSTSSVDGNGLEQLMELIVKSLVPGQLFDGQAVPFKQRHVDWIDSRLANF
jgi:tRNA modification GTPase